MAAGVKRLRLALACALALAGGAAGSAPHSESVHAGHPHDALYGVSFEGGQGVAVGDFGLVVSSADGGRSWQRRPAPFTDLALFDVVRRKGRCIAVGQSGAIFSSSDCVTWRAAQSGTKARLLGVDVNAQGIAYAVGGFGTLLRSADWGATWQAVQPEWTDITEDGAEPHLYAVRVDDKGVATVTGEFELILRGAGSGWKRLHRGKRSLFGLELLDTGEGYAVGQEGAFLRSTDFGQTWQSVEMPSKGILTGVAAQPGGRIVVSGVYSIFYSEDQGRSWQRDASKDVGRRWYQSIATASDGADTVRTVAVGAGGEIRTLIDNPRTISMREEKR